MSLKGLSSTSNLVLERRFIECDGGNLTVWLAILGNYVAKELSKKELIHDCAIDIYCGIPLSAYGHRINYAVYDLAQVRCSNANYLAGRIIWPLLDQKKMHSFPRMPNIELSDNSKRAHVRKVGPPTNHFCRIYLHGRRIINLCLCSALECRRLQQILRQYFESLSDVSSLELSRNNMRS